MSNASDVDVYVITYDHPHRKTQDLLFRLKLARMNVGVLALKWQERRNHRSLFETGLPGPLEPGPEQLCSVLGFRYRWVGKIDEHFHWTTDKPILIGGCPVLSGDFVTNNRVINVHPGWLPKVRGLDSLKWAITYGYPIGVTVHRIDAEVDLGKLIKRREVPLYPTDSIQSIAARQYEIGLNLLIQTTISGKIFEETDYGEPAGAPSRRMKHVDELAMMARLKRRLIELQPQGELVYADGQPIGV